MLMQFLLSGLTVGATYALTALGFTMIYNASHVINFAQGEFIMLGGMLAVVFMGLDIPLPLALLLAVLLPTIVGVILQKIAIAPAKGSGTTALIIITIGAALVIRGLVQVTLGKNTRTLAPFSGDTPIPFLGAVIQPQSIWILLISAILMFMLWYFFRHSLTGKAMLATSQNRLAAELVGINTDSILALSFALSAALGAFAGVLITPITMTSYDIGIMLGLKGFVSAVFGGLGNGLGAVVGGLLLGILEAFGAGYLSSEYKDAIPFVLILLVLFFMPNGLFGVKSTDRV